MDFTDKRKMERFSLELPACISVKDEDGIQKTIELKTDNICAGGAFFKIDKPLSVGTDVIMKVLLPFKEIKTINHKVPKVSCIDVTGSVMRRERHGMAVFFDKKYHISPFFKRISE